MTDIYGRKVVAALMLLMLALQGLNTVTSYSLNAYGLYPRALSGLPGLLVSPWLHSSWAHLMSNLVPFVAMSAIVLREGLSKYASVSAAIIVFGGLMVWCLGRSGVHVGASGWVFGLWGFILASTWFTRSLGNIVAALAVVAFYGGMIFGFVPQQGVSFESHIAGALAGWGAAWVHTQRRA